MFNDVNKVMLIGNVTNDPDLRFTNSGSAVLNFSIATNRSYKLDDDWKDEVTYHNIVLWRTAEPVAKRMKKGTRVYIEGRIQTRSWDGNDGQKKYRTEVVADQITLLARYDGAKDGGGSNDDTPPPSNEPASSVSSSSSDDIIDPDDLPF